MKKALLFLILTILGGTFLTSCLVTSKVQSDVTYTSSTFSKEMIEQGGIGLLPIVAGMGVEGYRRPFGEAMNEVGKANLTNFLTWNIMLDMLNQAELVTDYNNAIRSYQETGIIDRAVLRKISDATKVNYFIFVRLAPPQTDRRSTYISGYGISTTETKSVTGIGLIWSALDGDVVWEGSSTAEVVTGDYSYTKETDMDRAKKVADALMLSILN